MPSSLAEVLLESGVITKADLGEVLSHRRDSEESLGSLLVRTGKITERDRVRALAELYAVPFVDVARTAIDPELARRLPHNLAVKFTAIPVEQRGELLVVAMADPSDVAAADEISGALGGRIEPAIALADDILEAIFRLFGAADDFDGLASQALAERDADAGETELQPLAVTRLEDLAQGPPVARLVNAIIARAVAAAASDVHVEAQRDRVRVRFRVDGVLREAMWLPGELKSAVASRVKVLARMDIAERRAPQDGRFSLAAPPKEYDVRVSTYPSLFGESVVMRILDKSRSQIALEGLGMSQDVLDRWKEVLSHPNGFGLVCGPTGSGKTTCLCASLNLLNRDDSKIITIEDPVEYQIPGIVQAHVNPRAGLTFASGLRSIVRQDPDVVLVGEIRDAETAEIAIHAALTGHLVLSTLHTNQSAGAAVRLVEMGIEPFLIASSLIAVLSIRLVRLVCPACAQEVEPQPAILEQLDLPPPDPPAVRYRRGQGCSLCSDTGYSGRSGVFELLPVDDAVRDAIMARAPASEIERRAVAAGMTPLLRDALDRAKRGDTTVEEVTRVAASLVK